MEGCSWSAKMVRDENAPSSNLGLLGTAFAVLIGAILIITEARSGQSPTSTPALFLYGLGSLLIVPPSIKYYFQLRGIDIDIGSRIGFGNLKGSNAIGKIEVKGGGSLDLHQEAKTESPRLDDQQLDFERFDVCQDFGLWESGDYRPFEFSLNEGDQVVGYVSSEDDVSAHVLNKRSFSTFDNDNSRGFTSLWETGDGTYHKINFTAEESGTYVLMITNLELDDEDDADDFDDDDEEEDEVKVPVKVRLNSRRRGGIDRR